MHIQSVISRTVNDSSQESRDRSVSLLAKRPLPLPMGPIGNAANERGGSRTSMPCSIDHSYSSNAPFLPRHARVSAADNSSSLSFFASQVPLPPSLIARFGETRAERGVSAVSFFFSPPLPRRLPPLLFPSFGCIRQPRPGLEVRGFLGFLGKLSGQACSPAVRADGW